MNIAGKDYIVADIQPEYEKSFSFKIGNFCEFLDAHNKIYNQLIFLYNGNDTLGMIDVDEYKFWLAENGLHNDVINFANFYDKGYAFFRYCMDSGLDDDVTINFVRFMYNNNVNDSRDMNREMWAKYLWQYRQFDRKQAYKLLSISSDCVVIPDLMDYIKQYNNIVLTGGGIYECLKEVEIAINALNIPYIIDNSFTY